MKLDYSIESPPNICLFCGATEAFSTIEHPIPESLGNDDIVIPVGFVCDKCNQYFGTKIEQTVLNSPPFNVERTGAAIKTKKNKFSKFVSSDVSLFSTGAWDEVLFFGSRNWYKRTFIDPDGGIFCLDQPKNHRLTLNRFLLKVGLELLLYSKDEDPYNKKYDQARQCARFGKGREDWQIGYAHYPNRSDLIPNRREDNISALETRRIFSYEIGVMPNGDRILFFMFITHIFTCNLSQTSLREYVEGFNQINDFNMMYMR